MAIKIKKVTAGVAANRPTVGYPGQIYIVYSATAAPEFTIWDQVADDWVELNPTEMAVLEGEVATAGTATASTYLGTDSNNEVDSADISGATWVHGGITYKYEDVTIAAAAVKTLNATPVDLTTAPGAANYIEFIGAQVWLDHAGADYDGVAAGEDLVIIVETSAKVVAECEATGFGDASADEARYMLPSHPTAAVWDLDGTAHLNKKLQAQILSGEWYAAAGDGVLKFRTFYKIIPKELPSTGPSAYASETLT
jgi:hypothetical protein